MQRIGVVGAAGIVGSASVFGFRKLGHEVLEHDLRYNTKLTDLIEAEIIYISVPTPQNEDGSCDTSIVEQVIRDLSGYEGVICIRSTVVPGTTEEFIKKYNSRICFVPEFLRERCAISDFVENNNILAVGTNDISVFEKIKESFGSYPKSVMQMSPAEAEMLKYYHNCMNALRVIIANSFYEVSQKVGCDYAKIKQGILKSLSLPDIYLDVNSSMRGYGGTCLRKDIPAMNALVKTLGLDLKLFDFMEKENAKFKTTVFPGMRM